MTGARVLIDEDGDFSFERVVSARALQATRAGAASALREAHRYGARRDTRAPSAALGAKVAAMSASVDSFGREGAASERGRAVVETRARVWRRTSISHGFAGDTSRLRVSRE